MDKENLHKKAEQAINQAFDMAKFSAKVFSEKAGETANTTKLLIEKMTLEHKVTKQFAKLGNCIYEKSTRQGKSVSTSDREIKGLIDETKKLDSKLAAVEATLDKERQARNKRKNK